jgi:UDP-3-O-[3-hydroxymyristoyl] glucosamine N-acyltransferase
VTSMGVNMFKLAELARQIGAELYLPPGLSEASLEVDILRIAPIGSAGSGEVTFVASAAFIDQMATTGAAAVIVAERHSACAKVQLIHPSPYLAYAKTAQLFYKPEQHAPGISPMAYVAPDAVVDPSATVLPLASVMSGATIGAQSVLYPGVYVGRGAKVGANSELRANVVVEAGVEVGNRVLIHAGAVLGADGFGFAPGAQGLEKIPQTGRVVVGDNVEIGALSTIDRGALEDTVLGAGTKLDSHVHVGHGVTIGQHSVLCAFVGIAGSAQIGNGVVLGGHVGVSNKIRIADGVQVGAMSGVTKDLDDKGVFMGFPAVPAGEWRRQIAGARRVPDRLAELEKKVRDLELKLGQPG